MKWVLSFLKPLRKRILWGTLIKIIGTVVFLLGILGFFLIQDAPVDTSQNQNYFKKPTDFQKHTDPTKNLSRIRKLNSYTLHLLTHTTMNTLSFAWNMENTSCVKSHSQSMHPRPVKYLALQKKKNSCCCVSAWPWQTWDTFSCPFPTLLPGL